MTDYYIYLFKVAWPQALGMFVLLLFVFVRLIWKGWIVFAKKKTSKSIVLFILKSVGWSGILSVYIYMFYLEEPDWFSRPVWAQGSIESKVRTESFDRPYGIRIQTNTELITLHVDSRTYQELKEEQKVILSYSPYRMDVITCEILEMNQ